MKTRLSTRGLLYVAVTSLLAAYAVLPSQIARAAACTAPAVDYGTATVTLSVPTTATYRLWSRIMVPDGVSNTYMLEVDGATCYTVGGGNIPANAWTWVDYQNGSTSTKAQQSLAGGTHTLKFIGTGANVKIDRLIAVSDLACVPSGFGDNCNVPDQPTDTTPPTVSMTSPQADATVAGDITLAANASDNVGVSKVEFYADSTLVGSDTTSPYSVTLATSSLPNGAHLLTARGYDAAGNVGADTRTANVLNGDMTGPTTPTNVQASAAAYNLVNLTWTASTDNTGVTGYTIVRNGVTIASVSAVTSYQDSTVAANTTYSYQVRARDAAGNTSALSATASVTTPNVPDTQAPTAPTNLTATAVSTSQINLTWTAATDNVGVVSYDVYRGTAKIATVTSASATSFGDTGLLANTQYSYTVKARDAAGNVSASSSTATATTKAPAPSQLPSTLTGVVRNRNGRALSSVTVTATPAGTTSRVVSKTSTTGAYTLSLPANFNGQVSYSKTGYRTLTMTLNIASGQVMTQNVTLSRR